jgi:hypothetical protein
MTIIRDRDNMTGMKVNKNNQAEVHSASAEQIHYYSESLGQAYGVTCESSIAAAKVVACHIKNTSSDLDLVVEEVWVQTVAEGGTVPAVGMFWEVDLGRTYSSTGAAVVPTNLNSRFSSTVPEATIYQTSPTLAGTAKNIHKKYAEADGKQELLQFEGAVILGPQGTAEISYTSTGTAGRAVTTCHFYFEEKGAG